VNNDNILRIKINGIGLIKLSKQHGGRDFVITYPPVIQKDTRIESHFSLHTPNNRVTFKTTSIKINGIEQMPSLLKNLEKNPTFINKITPTDLDLYRETVFDLTDPNKMTYLGTIALNIENSSLNKYFLPPKTHDNKFKLVKDIKIPASKKNKITIKFGVAKNFTGDLSKLISKYQDNIILKEKNYTDDLYTFAFLIEYKFPDIKKQATIQVSL